MRIANKETVRHFINRVKTVDAQLGIGATEPVLKGVYVNGLRDSYHRTAYLRVDGNEWTDPTVTLSALRK